MIFHIHEHFSPHTHFPTLLSQTQIGTLDSDVTSSMTHTRTPQWLSVGTTDTHMLRERTRMWAEHRGLHRIWKNNNVSEHGSWENHYFRWIVDLKLKILSFFTLWLTCHFKPSCWSFYCETQKENFWRIFKQIFVIVICQTPVKKASLKGQFTHKGKFNIIRNLEDFLLKNTRYFEEHW